MKDYVEKLMFLMKANMMKANIIGACTGICVDIFTPIITYQLYIIIILVLLAIITGFLWYKDAKFQTKNIKSPEKNEFLTKNIKSQVFFIALVITSAFAGTIIIQHITNNAKAGILSENIDVFEKLQHSLISMKDDAKNIKHNTDRMTVDLELIRKNTERMAQLYSMQDLMHLKQTKQWKNILSHLNDIDPRLRDSDWFELLHISATNHLASLYDFEENNESNLNSFKNLLKEYPSLRDHNDFMQIGSKIFVEWSNLCFTMEYQNKSYKNASQEIIDCTKASHKFLKLFKNNFQITEKVITGYIKYNYRRYALDFYIDSFESSFEKRYCESQQLHDCLKDAILSAHPEIVAKAQNIIKNYCPNITFDK